MTGCIIEITFSGDRDLDRSAVLGIIHRSGITFDSVKTKLGKGPYRVVVASLSHTGCFQEAYPEAQAIESKLQSAQTAILKAEPRVRNPFSIEVDVTVKPKTIEPKLYQVLLRDGKSVEVRAHVFDKQSGHYCFFRDCEQVAGFPADQIQGVYEK